MSTKETGSLVLPEFGRSSKAEEACIDFEALETSEGMTREERIKEASKPLYLKRYE